MSGGFFFAHSTYDPWGRVTEAADPNGNRVYYQYDKIGRVTKETYPFNSHTNQTPTKEIAYEDGYNRMVVKDENGYRTRYEYNGLGELTAVVDADSGVVYEGITYDNRGRRKTETAYHTGHATVTSYGYDVFDRVTGKTVSGRQAGNSSGILYQETTTYDDVLDGKWNRQTVTVLGDDPAPLGELANGHGAQAVTTVTYTNALGQVVRQGVLADGKEYCGISAYDKAGNRVSAHDARGHRTTWEYNYAGQVVKETDPAGHFSRTEYDALGNAVQFWDKMHSSESDVSVLSEYDALGRLVEQQTPHIYGLPIPGPWVQYAVNNTVRYGYDAAGNVTEMAIPEVRKTAYTYDNRNRLRDTIQYEGDGRETRTRQEYDNAGNPAAVWTGMLGESTEGARKTGYAYNRFGQAVRVTDPMGGVEQYGYDAYGRLAERTDRKGNRTGYGYDGLGRETERTVWGADGSIVSFTTGYTRTGQVLCQGGGTAGRPLYYGYDGFGNLVRATEYVMRYNQFMAGSWREYGYDANGNQLGSRVEVLVPRGKKGHGRVFYGKGESGDVETSTLLEYNSLDQLVFSHRDGKHARYTWRADGLRHGKETWGLDKRHSVVTHFWDGDQVVAEMHTQKEGGLETAWANVHYLRGAGLLGRTLDGNRQTYLHNSHGDVSARLDANGTPLKYYHYDAFGVEEDPEPMDANPFRYCGEYWDSETETLYLRARSYDPKTGRFTQEDVVRSVTTTMPNEQEVLDPLSLNLYTYCHNDPVKYVDISGNSIAIALIVIGLLYVATSYVLHEANRMSLNDPFTPMTFEIPDPLGLLSDAFVNNAIQTSANILYATRALKDVKAHANEIAQQREDKARKYQLTYLYNGELIKHHKHMTFAEAEAAMVFTDVVKTKLNNSMQGLAKELFNEYGQIGIYTHDQKDAKLLAISLGIFNIRTWVAMQNIMEMDIMGTTMLYFNLKQVLQKLEISIFGMVVS